jgi:hypothetical protein
VRHQARGGEGLLLGRSMGAKNTCSRHRICVFPVKGHEMEFPDTVPVQKRTIAPSLKPISNRNETFGQTDSKNGGSAPQNDILSALIHSGDLHV